MAHRLDMHIHSCYSVLDGLMSPRAVIRLAKRLGYSAVAVTDHYTHDRALKGTLAAHRLAREEGLHSYKGLEYSVRRGPDRGHLLIYFDDISQVPARGLPLAEVLEHVRAHDLAIIHPHPLGYAGIDSDGLMFEADAIELNGSYGRGPVNEGLIERVRSLGVAHKLVASSDAHARGQMGSAFTEAREIHPHLADTLRTKVGHDILAPRRSWGRAAKAMRAAFPAVGLPLNSVQKLLTRRALRQLALRSL